jgi:hypothetical protein
MKILRYQKTVTERRSFEFDEPVFGYKKWVRISENGDVKEWKPLEYEQHITLTEDQQRKLENKYYHDYHKSEKEKSYK